MIDVDKPMKDSWELANKMMMSIDDKDEYEMQTFLLALSHIARFVMCSTSLRKQEDDEVLDMYDSWAAMTRVRIVMYLDGEDDATIQ